MIRAFGFGFVFVRRFVLVACPDSIIISLRELDFPSTHTCPNIRPNVQSLLMLFVPTGTKSVPVFPFASLLRYWAAVIPRFFSL